MPSEPKRPEPAAVTTAEAAQRACPYSSFAVCRASSCMAWHWADEPARLGYCVLLSKCAP
jgi:hypothetical protein